MLYGVARLNGQISREKSRESWAMAGVWFEVWLAAWPPTSDVCYGNKYFEGAREGS